MQQKYKVADETLEGIEMSVNAIGLNARDRLIEELQSDSFAATN